MLVLPKVNEGGPITCTILAYDETDDLTLPITMTYTVIDKLTKTVMQSGELGDGTIDTDELAKSVSVSISGENNTIVDQKRPYERRLVIVTVNTNVMGIGEYQVDNVRSILNAEP